MTSRRHTGRTAAFSKTVNHWLANVGVIVQDLIYPPRCVSCRIPERALLCAACSAKLPRIEGAICQRCGIPLVEGGEYCRQCAGASEPFEYVRAGYVYTGIIRTLIFQCKYQGSIRTGKALAGMIGEYAAVRAVEFPVDLVMPIPLHPTQLRERMFNQSALLAEEVGHRLGIPVVGDELVRSRKTAPQYPLSRVERMRNMRGAFSVPVHASLKDRAVLLVDDIATSLATLREAACVLKEAGSGHVFCLTLARELHPGVTQEKLNLS